MCWYPVPVSVPVNVIRQLPLGRGRLHKAIRHQLLCCAEGRARTHPRLPNVGFRHTGFSETSFPQSVYITLALYRLADFGLGPYLLVPDVLSCTVNTSNTIHPMNRTKEMRTHQPLRSVS